jgi:hypothetical protein
VTAHGCSDTQSLAVFEKPPAYIFNMSDKRLRREAARRGDGQVRRFRNDSAGQEWIPAEKRIDSRTLAPSGSLSGIEPIKEL